MATLVRSSDQPSTFDRMIDGRIQGDAGRQAPLHQEQERRQLPGLAVEAVLQELVGGVDLQPVVDRHHHRRQEHHRQRQPEVELHEAHAVLVGLARRRQKRDGAGLGGHHRQADGDRGVLVVAPQVALAAGHARARPPHAVDADESQGAQQHHPVERRSLEHAGHDRVDDDLEQQDAQHQAVRPPASRGRRADLVRTGVSAGRACHGRSGWRTDGRRRARRRATGGRTPARCRRTSPRPWRATSRPPLLGCPSPGSAMASGVS